MDEIFNSTSHDEGVASAYAILKNISSYTNSISLITTHYKYLTKLCSPSLHKLFFHRLGSLLNEINNHPIDAYEIVNQIGTIWDIIFIDFYHPRRSNLAPQGYSLKPYNKKIGDMPFAFGVNIYCNDFPNDLPEKIKTHNGLIAFARKVSSSIQENNFSPPESHKLKVITIESKIDGRK